MLVKEASTLGNHTRSAVVTMLAYVSLVLNVRSAPR